MIRLSDIRVALMKLLSSEFSEYPVTGEDISQADGLDGLVMPCLHLQLEMQGSSLAMGADTKDKTILADVTFMDSRRASNAKMYEVQDRMEQAVGTGFWVGDRFLHVQQLNGTIADDLLHVTFQVDFNDVVLDQTESYELFDELEMKI